MYNETYNGMTLAIWLVTLSIFLVVLAYLVVFFVRIKRLDHLEKGKRYKEEIEYGMKIQNIFVLFRKLQEGMIYIHISIELLTANDTEKAHKFLSKITLNRFHLMRTYLLTLYFILEKDIPSAKKYFLFILDEKDQKSRKVYYMPKPYFLYIQWSADR